MSDKRLLVQHPLDRTHRQVPANIFIRLPVISPGFEYGRGMVVFVVEGESDYQSSRLGMRLIYLSL